MNDPCRNCSSGSASDPGHIYGQRTCCPDCDHRAPRLSETEAAIVARFEAAEAAPESYVRQHRSEADCWCGPIQVGTLGVWTHQMGGDQ